MGKRGPKPKSLPVVRRSIMGRPTIYTEELADEICYRISRGELVLRMCEKEGMPERQTIYLWVQRNPEFKERFDAARQAQAHYAAELAVEAGREATPENANAARVKMDANKWYASILNPRSYGTKTTTESSVTVDVRTTIDAEKLDAVQRDALRSALVAATRASNQPPMIEHDPDEASDVT
jgi:hypothetical protein